MTRRAKPALLLHITGSKRARAEPDPEPEGELREAPDWLTFNQGKIWEHAIENAPGGLLRKIDRGTLLAYVIAADLHQQASIMISKTGLTAHDIAGRECMSPYVTITARQAAVMLKAIAELGFSPTSRAGIAKRRSSVNPFAQNGKRPEPPPAA